MYLCDYLSTVQIPVKQFAPHHLWCICLCITVTNVNTPETIVALMLAHGLNSKGTVVCSSGRQLNPKLCWLLLCVKN